jgi:hypothetical protein
MQGCRTGRMGTRTCVLDQGLARPAGLVLHASLYIKGISKNLLTIIVEYAMLGTQGGTAYVDCPPTQLL